MMQNLTEFFKGISDQTRQRIVHVLMSFSPLSVNQLCQALNEPQSKISRHLKILRNSGWVINFRRDNWIYNRLNPEIDPVLFEALKKIFREYLEFQNDLKNTPAVN